MKLFRAIVVAIFMTCVRCLKDSPVTLEPWFLYTRSGLLNKALSMRVPEKHVVSLQRIQDSNQKEEEIVQNITTIIDLH